MSDEKHSTPFYCYSSILSARLKAECDAQQAAELANLKAERDAAVAERDAAKLRFECFVSGKAALAAINPTAEQISKALEAKIESLKAERDEAIAERDEVHRAHGETIRKLWSTETESSKLIKERDEARESVDFMSTRYHRACNQIKHLEGERDKYEDLLKATQKELAQLQARPVMTLQRPVGRIEAVEAKVEKYADAANDHCNRLDARIKAIEALLAAR